jgi:hypothetical protein
MDVLDPDPTVMYDDDVATLSIVSTVDTVSVVAALILLSTLAIVSMREMSMGRASGEVGMRGEKSASPLSPVATLSAGDSPALDELDPPPLPPPLVSSSWRSGELARATPPRPRLMSRPKRDMSGTGTPEIPRMDELDAGETAIGVVDAVAGADEVGGVCAPDGRSGSASVSSTAMDGSCSALGCVLTGALQALCSLRAPRRSR